MKRKQIKRAALAILTALTLSAGSFAETAENGAFNVQRRLNELGFCTAAEEITEEQLHTAIRDFQQANGLEATGVADSATVAAMRSEDAAGRTEYLALLAEQLNALGTLASGSYGDSVRALQEALRELGYYDDECDGSFGDSTALAVNRFQLANGLTETGIADHAVLIRLFSGEPVRWSDFISANLAASGDSGEHVRMLQVWLRRMGFFKGECTGEYGTMTRKAVERYQESVSLEITGDVDEATARKLFPDAALALAAGATVRRGDSGSRAAEMCEKLRLLGYRAHESFDMQTEMALMQFQRKNGLNATGEADSATMAAIRLQAQDGEPAELPEPAESAPIDAALLARVSETALSLLGQSAEFDENDDFVRYVFLKCGVDLEQAADGTLMPLPENAMLTPGWAVCADVGESAVWGVAASADSMVLSDESGFIVLRCLSAMDAEQVRVPRNML